MKILVLCTYPIGSPAHGGQLRVRNIVDTYRSAGHAVEVRGVLGSEHYDAEVGFLPYPGVNELNRIVTNPFLMEDYAIGQLCVVDGPWYTKLASTISEAPDVIHVEQPWLFAFAARYKAECSPSSILVYGSQNIEWKLKKEILKSYVGDDLAQQGAAMIREVEEFSIRNSDAVICVSESDVAWVGGLTERPVILAENGVKPWRATEQGRKEAATLTKGYAYALYCASGHPPNVTGFFDMFGGGFGSLKPDESLVVVGGAGWAIAGDIRVHHSAKLAEKVVVAGIVSQVCLDALLEGAHCIVLPLTQGGGTNLKTAEALWSGKYVVATTVAMRGFERFIGATGIFLADDNKTFKRALRSAMSAPPLKLSPDEVKARRTVLWDHCLRSLPIMLESLASEVKA